MSQIGLFLIGVFVTFVYVGLRAFQQLNVVNRNYIAVMPTSILMSLGDVAMVMVIVRTDSLWMGLSNGLAGGAGCCVAMYLSHKIFGKERP